MQGMERPIGCSMDVDILGPPSQELSRLVQALWPDLCRRYYTIVFPPLYQSQVVNCRIATDTTINVFLSEHYTAKQIHQLLGVTLRNGSLVYWLIRPADAIYNAKRSKGY